MAVDGRPQVSLLRVKAWDWVQGTDKKQQRGKASNSVFGCFDFRVTGGD